MFENFYPQLLALHSLLRWLVLLTGLIAVFVAARGWLAARPFSAALPKANLAFVVAMDVTLLVGLLLYFGASPLTKTALQDMSAAMGERQLRFFAVEHTATMLLAVVFAHLGAALSRRATTDIAKYRRAAICFAISLVLLLAGIPWWRPLLRVGG
jgi:hypothetical protein